MHLFASKHPKIQDRTIAGPTGFFHRIGRDPYADWAIIFSLAIAIALLMAFLGFLTFESAVSRLNSEGISASTAPVRFDAQSLSNLLASFDGRAAERAKLLKAYDGPGDPSM